LPLQGEDQIAAEAGTAVGAEVAMTRLDWDIRERESRYHRMAVYFFKKSENEWGYGNISFSIGRLFPTVEDVNRLMEGIAESVQCPRENVVLLNLIDMAP
jgi:hypothetical protein